MTLTKRGKDWVEGYKQGALEELKGLISLIVLNKCCSNSHCDGHIIAERIIELINKRIKELEKGLEK